MKQLLLALLVVITALPATAQERDLPPSAASVAD